MSLALACANPPARRTATPVLRTGSRRTLHARLPHCTDTPDRPQARHCAPLAEARPAHIPADCTNAPGAGAAAVAAKPDPGAAPAATPQRFTPARAFTSRSAACLFFLSVAVVATPVAAQSGGVRIGIHISADAPAALHAWRRAIGLEPPDPAADAQWRSQANWPSSADAARERRRRRTLPLIPLDSVAVTAGTVACLPLPATSDPCSQVIAHDPREGIISITGY